MEAVKGDLAQRLQGASELVLCLLLPFMLSVVAPAAIAPAAIAQETPSGIEPTIWSRICQWDVSLGVGNAQIQFREYHDYESTKARMQYLADTNPDIISFHEDYSGG